MSKKDKGNKKVIGVKDYVDQMAFQGLSDLANGAAKFNGKSVDMQDISTALVLMVAAHRRNLKNLAGGAPEKAVWNSMKQAINDIVGGATVQKIKSEKPRIITLDDIGRG